MFYLFFPFIEPLELSTKHTRPATNEVSPSKTYGNIQCSALRFWS